MVDRIQHIFIIYLFWVMIASQNPATAEVSTDGSLGPVRSLSGPDYQVTHDLGTLTGQNLFHSFQNFSLISGESATFTGPSTIANVISRVTGGNMSSINGRISSQVGQADFYFINPSGVVFGPDAQVDVPSAFHVSTAGGLTFSDGAFFQASNTGASSLSAGAPEAFGFLAAQSVSIVLNGSALNFSPGAQVSLSAGNIQIQGDLSTLSPNIACPQGHISLTAVGGTDLFLPIGSKQFLSPAGEIHIDNGFFDVSGTGNSAVLVTGGHVSLSSSVIAAGNFADEDNTEGITIAGKNIDMESSYIFADTYGTGKSGQVSCEAAESLYLGPQTLIGNTTMIGSGETGDVKIKAGTLVMDNATVTTTSQYALNGSAGNVSVDVDGTAHIKNLSFISSDTDDGGPGGNVWFNAHELVVDHSCIRTTTSNTETGNAGSVTISIDNTLQMGDQAWISSDSYSGADTGNLFIKAKSLALDNAMILNTLQNSAEGDAGAIDLEIEESVSIVNSSRIGTDSEGQGRSGNISLNTQDLTIMSASAISTYFTGTGTSGDIEIKACDILLDGQNHETGTRIASASFEDAINSGDIHIISQNSIEIRNGASISSSAQDGGDAGNLYLETNNFVIESPAPGKSASVTSATYHTQDGSAGEIHINADDTLSILEGAIISAYTHGSRSSGKISVNANQILMTTGGVISGSSFGNGNGAEIDIHVAGTLDMKDGATIANYITGQGDGGDIRIESGQIQMGNASISTYGTATSSGHAGKVELISQGPVQLAPNATISTFSEGMGNAGDIWIQAPSLFIDGQGADQFTGISTDAVASHTEAAGDIFLEIFDEISLSHGSMISSATIGEGHAGDIRINTRNLTLDGGEQSASIRSHTLGTGNAGNISIQAEDSINLISGGVIISSTFSQGNAGNIDINTGRLYLDGMDNRLIRTGLVSEAADENTGMTGNIDVNAGQIHITNTANVSIARWGDLSDNISDPEPHHLNLTADSLYLRKDSDINSSAKGNGSASQIQLIIADQLMVDNSRISTEADEGDGGGITIDADSFRVRDGQVTTSTQGGNGGDITLGADVLVLDTGFIQANTLEGARGGDILINTKALIAQKEQLEVGGTQRQVFETASGLNVIQAAAPGGEQGDIDITAPELDIAGALIITGLSFYDPATLATNPCSFEGGQGQNSLVTDNRSGSIPPGNFLDISWANRRLDELINTPH